MERKKRAKRCSEMWAGFSNPAAPVEGGLENPPHILLPFKQLRREVRDAMPQAAENAFLLLVIRVTRNS